MHIDDILSFLHEEDHTEEEYLNYIPDDLETTYQRRLRSAQNRSESAIKFEEELNDLFKKMTNDMQEAGVKILAGSDAGAYNSFVYPGISLHKELEQMVSSGLTPLEALQTSILNGADFFNDYNEVGSITAGKQADLLFLNANPLEDITNTQEIYSVVSDGKVFNSEALQNLFTDSDI
ncbi:amidohydrolase family protein [Rhodohalobacter sp.]|uniref:amidohydrolase family protein n=1 Tax=Rhodohalobacter sp. TaxID=1974210 RepID=UPI002ACE38EB|nr:amidohydrolase family protein [Rhodohalobacter sp.]MDZ7756344.1 amidohydrolase family protein [Rhodohalobacter sp.]